MSWLQGFEDFVQREVSLAPMTTYRVGGPAQFFAVPPSSAHLSELLKRARENGIATYQLGHGTNLLVADRGVRGLVVRLPKTNFGQLTRDGMKIRVGAGHSLPGLVKWSVANGLSGLECLQGVPGTVGAALRMNAGGKYGEIGSRVRRVHGLENSGAAFQFDTNQCGFTYRNSLLGGRIVMECELELQPGDRTQSELQMREILTEKCRSQPVDARSAGCAFKNPKLSGIPPAGMLIDQLGLKGARVGGASVSHKHANFLVCEQGATAGDLAALIRLIRGRALRERSVELQLEVETWGFSADELQAA